MIRILQYIPETHKVAILAESALPDALCSGKGTIWIDMQSSHEAIPAMTTFLQTQFQFHPLSIDDALHESQSARVDDWHDYLYMAFHAIQMSLEKGLELHEIDYFLGRNFLITIHNQPLDCFDKPWNDILQNKDFRLCQSADRLLYHILDLLSDQALKAVEAIDERLESIEQDIYEKASRSTVSELFHLRRSILRLRRCFSGQREAVNRLARDSFQVIREEDRIYFRDVYDHLVRMFEITDGLRDMASGAMESYLSVTSARTNEVMRTLTVVTVLFMPLTFITGFFGMNFFGEKFNIDNPLNSGWEFWLCSITLLLLPVLMFLWMTGKGWLRSSYPISHFDEPARRKQKRKRDLPK